MLTSTIYLVPGAGARDAERAEAWRSGRARASGRWVGVVTDSAAWPLRPATQRAGTHSHGAAIRSGLLSHSAGTWAALPRPALAERWRSGLCQRARSCSTPHRAQLALAKTAWLLGRTGWSTRPIASGTDWDGRESSALANGLPWLTPLNSHDSFSFERTNISRMNENARAGVTVYVTARIWKPLPPLDIAMIHAIFFVIETRAISTTPIMDRLTAGGAASGEAGTAGAPGG